MSEVVTVARDHESGCGDRHGRQATHPDEFRAPADDLDTFDRAVADSGYWELARIHDPRERAASQLLSSAVTVLRVEGEDD